MIASLPMYDRDEVRAVTERYWGLIAAELGRAGIDAPATLERPDDLMSHWTSPDLVLSQTCGLPLATDLKGKVTLVATPDFGLPGCPPGEYNSVVVARADADAAPRGFHGARLAYNGPRSNSGFMAALVWGAIHEITYGEYVESGSHRASANAVAEGKADLAMIDAQTWRYISHLDPVADALQVIDRTPPNPGLPYITALGTDPEPIAAAIEAAIAALESKDRRALGLVGLVRIPLKAYDAFPDPPTPEALKAAAAS